MKDYSISYVNDIFCVSNNATSKIHKIVRHKYSETCLYQNSAAGIFRFVHVLDVWIIRTPDTVFRCAQVSVYYSAPRACICDVRICVRSWLQYKTKVG